MFDEFLVVFAYSKRTQWVLIIGLVFFFGLMLGGAYWSDHLELKSLSAPVAEVVRDKIVHRYDKAAWGILVATLFAAIKCYRKDRKRLGL